MVEDQTSRVLALLDREELFDLVRRERFARDQMRFDVMRACFHDNAYVRTSWYDGYGGDSYVEASMLDATDRPGAALQRMLTGLTTPPAHHTAWKKTT